MAYAHIGHDSTLGSHIILANAATLAGHVTIEDHATIGAFSGVHQFCRVGSAWLRWRLHRHHERCAAVFENSQRAQHAAHTAPNTIGLERKGFSLEQIQNIKAAFRLLLQSKLNTTQAVEAIKAKVQSPGSSDHSGFHRDVGSWRHQVDTALIAGNGKFPFLVLEAARSQGIEMVVAAIKEETFPEIEQHAKTVHWMSLGQLGKLIKTFKSEGVNHAIMAGPGEAQADFQLDHSGPENDPAAARPRHEEHGLADRRRGVRCSKMKEFISIDSTLFLRPLLPDPGVLTRACAVSETNRRDLDYGYKSRVNLGGLDLGQSVAVSDGACVALEAMEGTDAVMERAASLVNGRMLRVVKLAKPNQDLRFDVPVIGSGYRSV